jgi:hypothetical protein
MRAAVSLLARIMNMVGAGCGVGAMDCVRLPAHLAYSPNVRARRLVRNAQACA